MRIRKWFVLDVVQQIKSHDDINVEACCLGLRRTVGQFRRNFEKVGKKDTIWDRCKWFFDQRLRGLQNALEQIWITWPKLYECSSQSRNFCVFSNNSTDFPPLHQYFMSTFWSKIYEPKRQISATISMTRIKRCCWPLVNGYQDSLRIFSHFEHKYDVVCGKWPHKLQISFLTPQTTAFTVIVPQIMCEIYFMGCNINSEPNVLLDH